VAGTSADGAYSGPGAAAALPMAAGAGEGSASRATTGGGSRAGWPQVLLLAVLALSRGGAGRSEVSGR